MQLHLDADERALLTELLRSKLGEMRAEISRTDTYDFKQELKLRESRVARILARLAEAERAAGGR